MNLLMLALATSAVPPFLFSGPANADPDFGRSLDSAALACGYDPEAFQWAERIVPGDNGAVHMVQLRLQPDERTRAAADCLSCWMAERGYAKPTPEQAAAFVGKAH